MPGPHEAWDGLVSGASIGVNGAMHATDLRVQVAAGSSGWRPTAAFARRAPRAYHSVGLRPTLDEVVCNLSGPTGVATEERLVVLDDANASALGVTFDLLVTAFVHAVIAARAIDQFGCPR